MTKEAPTIPKKRVVRNIKREVSFFEKYLSFSSTLQLIGVAIVLCAAYVAIQSNYSGIKNLINADQATLKAAMTGDLPYLFYCNRGGKEEIVPPIFSELNSRLGSKFGFASLNCSQTLTSGKTIFDRFKLQKDWRPCIFGTAPWLSKPIQITPNHMKDTKTFSTFIDKNFSPKAVEIGTDNELKRICGFSKPSSSSDTPESEMSSIKNTCLVIVKGSQYTKSHTELEEKLIRHIPRVKICMIDANKKRLSIEDINSFPADTFGMKIYAIRNGTHYLPMTNPITWDYINTFVSYAFATPLNAYTSLPTTHSQKQIHLIKMASSFKDRSTFSGGGRYKNSGSGSSSKKSSSSSSSSSKKTKSASKSKSSGSSSSSSSSRNAKTDDDDDDNNNKENSDDNNNDDEDDNSDNDDEEEIIEL